MLTESKCFCNGPDSAYIWLSVVNAYYTVKEIIMKKLWSLLLICLVAAAPAFSQSNESFKGEIGHFLHQDSLKMPPKDAILFVGSSSFRKWTDVAQYFPGYRIINRGFGGSQLPNLIYYADKIIYPYQPRQVIIYCGENDFDYDKTISADSVFERFHQLFDMIREKLHQTNIGYVSIKFSPSRKYAWDRFEKTNSLIEDFLEEQSNAEYIDITKAMQDRDGQVDTSLFLGDQLHMKPAGYKRWQKEIQPYLLK